VKLRYTPEALVELADILDYLAERSPQAAKRVQKRIQSITTMLAQHPYARQITNKPPARRISTSPYLLLAIRHQIRSDRPGHRGVQDSRLACMPRPRSLMDWIAALIDGVSVA